MPELSDIAGLTPQDVTSYWVDTVGPSGWYKVDPSLDEDIRQRFQPLWEVSAAGGLRNWMCSPQRILGFLILTDQFPRNMFREDGRAFSTDAVARTAAIRSILHNWDLRIPEPQRQFFYLPLMHSEVLEDQERALRLIMTRMPETGALNLLHARAHREVIRQFGRFPHRNADLGRSTSRAEADFLAAGGYGDVVRSMQQATAA
ncbi:MAG: DUF924 family protein [Pseudomonadota bacterium]